MNLFGKKQVEEPKNAKLKSVTFKQAEGFKGFKAFRVDRFGLKANQELLCERLKASKGKNALAGDEPYQATIDFLPYYNENMKPCFFLFVDGILLGMVNDPEYSNQVISKKFDSVYIKADAMEGIAKVFVRYK